MIVDVFFYVLIIFLCNLNYLDLNEQIYLYSIILQILSFIAIIALSYSLISAYLLHNLILVVPMVDYYLMILMILTFLFSYDLIFIIK